MENSSKEWLHSIAEKSKQDLLTVESVLSKYHIYASPVSATPRRLMINEIVFQGIKDNDNGSNSSLNFEWKNLKNGLWAILTDLNLRGKSSVIEVVKWLIRGKVSGLQDDVYRWIHYAKLCFSLDTVKYEIFVKKAQGLQGKLIKFIQEDKPVTLASFNDGQEFELVMSNFFLKAFSMDHITNFRKGNENTDGKIISHGWSALAGVMFISTNYSVLLGDLPVTSGINARLIHMYLGLPWVSTLSAAKSAQKLISEAKEKQIKQINESKENQRTKIDNISVEIAQKHLELSKLPSNKSILDEITKENDKYKIYLQEQRLTTERLEREELAVKQSVSNYQQDCQDLQTHIDSEAAGTIFRTLDPSCCPRCDHIISETRKKQEKHTHACSVCGEIIEHSEDTEAIKNKLLERVNLSKMASKTTRRNLEHTREKLNEYDIKITECINRINELTNQLNSYSTQENLKREIALLEGRLQEIKGYSNELNVKDYSGELTILNSTIKEVELRIKDLQNEILTEISCNLTIYAKRFGISKLSDTILDSAGRLSLIKGNTPTSYSKATEGEKLRLKVATILAMLHVADKKGIGRHPGLLMIDSPSAQEVTPKDLSQLMIGLEGISESLPHLQVFIAGISSEAITSHVPTSNRKEAKGESYLW